MNKCKECGREMTGSKSCGIKWIRFANGEIYERIENEEENWIKNFDEEKMGWRLCLGRPCHDCGVAPGGYHHIGCDAEECPACGEQFISCACEK